MLDNAFFTPPYFSGSLPPLENGLHLNILQMPKVQPLNAPYFSIACFVYSEQDGEYLHLQLAGFL